MRFQGRTATAIIPFSLDQIVLIKRITPPFAGYWALPGGRAEKGEEVSHTVVREVREETGLDVEVIRKVGEYHEKGVQAGYEYDYYPACFVVRYIGGELRKQESEISDIKVFRLWEIPDRLAFEHAQMLRDFVSQEGVKSS